MGDASALVRVTDELLWALRRGGLSIATSQAIDVARSLALLGLEDRSMVKEAVAAVVVTRASERPLFDTSFERFFSGGARLDLWERLAGEGFSEAEREVLRELLVSMAAAQPDATLYALLEGRAELSRLLQLAGVAGALSSVQSPLQSGFLAHRVLEGLGTRQARDELAGMRDHLARALGDARADALVDILRRELEASSEEVRRHVREGLAARGGAEPERGLAFIPFARLTDSEIEEVRRAVRAFAQRLRGGEQVRRKRARRGRIATGPTMRRAFATLGVPMRPVRRARRRGKPRLVLLCDISDSVRAVAQFLLEFAFVAQELFDSTRTFVFVSELGETTRLFDQNPIRIALAKAYGGGVVSVASNSNYGRVLQGFASGYVDAVDRRTTVVILGDGRTNYLDDGASALDLIRRRARALLWLCPEPRSGWSIGDSAMSRYAPRCTGVLEVRTAHDLEGAARAILALR